MKGKNLFLVKYALVRHQAIHSSVKSFKCSICTDGRFFKTKDQFNQHMRFHYKPKFSCSFCHHKSYTTVHLKAHVITQLKK